MHSNTYKFYSSALVYYEYKVVLSRNYYSEAEARPSFKCIAIHSRTHLYN